MAQPNRLYDTHVAGALSCESFTAPDNSFGDDAVQTPSGTDGGIRATKVQQQYVYTYAQDGTAFSERKAVHCPYGAVASLVEIAAGAEVAKCTGNATVTIDAFKNGTSILTTELILDTDVALY